MRPNFALLILADGLDLLHRASPGWERVGHVSFDDADLSGALTRLRDLGQQLDPAPMRTKLILPNDQIRYLSVYTGATTEEDRRALVMSQLEGVTPYALEELSLCWSVSGTTTHVAAVARETLEEAESFAAENGLNPVSFVAVPGENSYLGEPFFGPTRLAAVLMPGETVERDAVQVHVLGNATLPPPAPIAEAPAETPSPAAKTPLAEPAAKVAPEADPRPESAAPAQVPAEPSAPKAESAPPATPATKPEMPDPEAPAPELTANESPETETPEAELPPVTFRARRDLFDLDAPVTPTPPARPAPVAKAKPKGSGAATGPGFASVRADRAAAPAVPDGPETAARPPAAKLTAKPKVTAPATPATAKAPEAPAPAPAGNAVARTKAVLAPKAAAPASPMADSRAQEAAQMTVFGARGARDETARAPRRPLPRLALMGGGLVVVLLLAWALLGGSEDEAAPEQTALLTPEASAPITAPEALGSEGEESAETAPAPQPEAPPAPSVPMEIRPAPATPAEAAARYAATGIWQRAPQSPVPPVATELGEIEVAAVTPADRVAGVTGLEDTGAESPAADISAPPNPPAAGQRFTLDDRGLVAGTPEGALTPEGHLVFSGPPPTVPPSRPAATLAPEAVVPAAATRPAPQPEGEAAAPETPATEAAPQVEEAALAATAPEDQLRPRLRPEGLAPEPDPEAESQPEAEAGTEAAEAAPDLDIDSEAIESASDLAASEALRPRPRPEDFAALVAAAQAAAAVAPPPVQVPTPSVAAPGPITASVARQATQERAINLNAINLIGVSGDPAARSALVRLSDGRIRKVEVGDQLDGGRVAAIGDGNLRYVKGNRSLLLEMPD